MFDTVSKLLRINLALFGTRFLSSPGEKIGRLPAMGWSSWNVYRCDINETLFVEVGNLMVSLGLKDLGYSYVNIDDCWSDKDYQRDDITRMRSTNLG